MTRVVRPDAALKRTRFLSRQSGLRAVRRVHKIRSLQIRSIRADSGLRAVPRVHKIRSLQVRSISADIDRGFFLCCHRYITAGHGKRTSRQRNSGADRTYAVVNVFKLRSIVRDADNALFGNSFVQTGIKAVLKILKQ